MRRTLDQYFTPTSATLALLDTISISGLVLECCSGDGAIAKVLTNHGCSVWTNDIDPAMPSMSHIDATRPEAWTTMNRPDWVVTNPPFSCCQPIIEWAMRSARHGVAMLLRLSYMEPCNNRAEFLACNPPNLIVLPRISFTGDGKTDNVTCAWCVWDFSGAQLGNRIVTKEELGVLMSRYRLADSGVSDPYGLRNSVSGNPTSTRAN